MIGLKGKVVWREDDREKVMRGFIHIDQGIVRVKAENSGVEKFIGSKQIVKIDPYDNNQTFLAVELVEMLGLNDHHDVLGMKMACGHCGNDGRFQVYFNACLNIESKDGKVDWSAIDVSSSLCPQIIEVQCAECGESVYVA